MMSPRSLLDSSPPVQRVDQSSEGAQPPGSVVATDDPGLIRQWARQHGAEPATGEATGSGPATVEVRDGGVGIRFNFPGASLFRPITWDEWLENFQRNDLIFVYERDAAGDLSGRYRLVPRQTL